MKIFGKCIIHKWEFDKKEYMDGDIVLYTQILKFRRSCKVCGKKQQYNFTDMKWRKFDE